MEDFIRGRIQEVMPVAIADIVAVYKCEKITVTLMDTGNFVQDLH